LPLGQVFNFVHSEKVESWTVPQSASYRLTAVGGKAGDGQNRRGGKGAMIEGTFK
jgi:hypothetical protein